MRPILVQLYGSVVKGKYKGPEKSDIDVMVVTRKPQTFPNHIYDVDYTPQIVDWTLADIQKMRNGPMLEEVRRGLTLFGDPSILDG